MEQSGYAFSEIEADGWKLRLSRAVARFRSDISFALVDAVVISVAYSAALVLEFADGQAVPQGFLTSFALTLPLVVAIHIGANMVFGAYGHVWEFASIEEAMRLVYATVLATALIGLGVVSLRQITGDTGPLPLTVAAAGSLVALGGMGALRFRSRMFSFRRESESPELIKTLVVGTGRPAAELARRASSNGRPRSVVGFVSVEEGHSSRRLAGRPVLGSLSEIPRLVEGNEIRELIVAASLDESLLSRLVDDCLEIDVRLRILPNLDQVLSDSFHFRDIRDLEIEDLLPRPPVSGDLTGTSSFLSGSRVLVTGAGGSIGSEMSRQLLGMSASIIALDNDETHLHDAMLSWPNADRAEVVLCDIRDHRELKRIVHDTSPDVVFHAAALKHVPILEEYPAEALKTNVFGTRNVLEAARSAGVGHFVLVSTDKAVDPENVLGATKRIAEMLVQSSAAVDGSMKCGAVRFGNVLGSRGSVVPTFMEQIRNGGPVTVTDPDMTRYFMTIPEAIGLVLQTATLAESGEVFVLDMGEPAKIKDLAHRMIRLAGLVPGRDIEVAVVGTRPGEKTTEILSVDPMEASVHPRIQIARPGFPGPTTMEKMLGMLRDEMEDGNRAGLAKLVRDVGRQDWRWEDPVDLTVLEEFAT